MHQFSRSPNWPPSTLVSNSRRKEAGFSLVEVSLAIGIIAFAFVALFGLLPTGMNVMRASMDIANETWIMQNLNSMVQVTPWKSIVEPGSGFQSEVYYFDEEGRLVDTKSKPSQGTGDAERRLYAVKLLVDTVENPAEGVSTGLDLDGARRIVAAFGNYTSPKARTFIEGLTEPQQLTAVPPDIEVHTHSFVIARMGSAGE